MKASHWLQYLWRLPSVKYLKTKEESIGLIEEITNALGIEEVNYNNYVINEKSVDISLLRFFIMCKILSGESRSINEYQPKIGVFCIGIKGLERPFQFFLSCGKENIVDIVIRGATTDQLIATGIVSFNDDSSNIQFTGSSTWHSSIANLLQTNTTVFRNEVKNVIKNRSYNISRLNICVDTYSNIGHALQNEIGPLLLADRKINGNKYLIAGDSGHYNIRKFFDCGGSNTSKTRNIDRITDTALIYRDCIIPTGSNPRLGIYASYKLSGINGTRVGDNEKKIRNNLSQYDEVIYISPRIDEKRGICINQEQLINHFLKTVKGKSQLCNRRIVILFEKLWYSDNNQTRAHNSFIDNLILKKEQLWCNNLTYTCLPNIKLHEKLYILRTVSAFVGAGGANFCTFFDWQGNETPGIIYGDYKLMIEGKYFKEFLHSIHSFQKIPGRYVLFGENINTNNHADNSYSISDMQILHGVRGLVSFLARKYE